MKLKTRDMLLAAIFAALTVIGAKVNFLLPEVPLTFQPIIVMLAGCFIGRRTAFLSQVVYIFTGFIGIPVFAKPIAGPAYILTPSFGFLIGFAAAAYVIGLIVEKNTRRNLATFLTANLTGLFIIYLFGVLHLYGLMNLYLNKPMSIMKAASVGAAPFIIKDIILGIAISFIARTLYPRIRAQLRQS
jgi:biotin transport system substrate-specific component